VAEGSVYETEKETGRGKRKKIRNRFFLTDSDEEIVVEKLNKKSVPEPPSVPFKPSVKKNIIQKTENELNNPFYPMTSFSSSKVSHMFVMNVKFTFKKRYRKFKNFNILEKNCSGILKKQVFSGGE